MGLILVQRSYRLVNVPGGGPGTGGTPAGGRLYVCGPAAAAKTTQTDKLITTAYIVHTSITKLVPG